MTLYMYQYDNSNGNYKRLTYGVIDCFELWDGDKPVNCCAESCPDEWCQYDVVHGPSPECKFR